MVDSHGMHLGGQFTSACPAEVKLTESTPGTVPDDIPIICLVADCTYDSDTLRDRLVYLGIDLNLPVQFPKKLTVKVDLKVEINLKYVLCLSDPAKQMGETRIARS